MSEWISVEERLPEKGDTVIAFGYSGAVFPAMLAKSGWLDMEEEYDAADDVTHWMPLPEPPL